MDKLYIYPLDNTTLPERPGVYFIYHVGKTQLYEGLKPGRSLHTLSRLCRNLTRALQIASKTIAKKLRGQVNKSNRPKVNRQTRRDIQKGNTRRESNSQKMKKRKRKKNRKRNTERSIEAGAVWFCGSVHDCGYTPLHSLHWEHVDRVF